MSSSDDVQFLFRKSNLYILNNIFYYGSVALMFDFGSWFDMSFYSDFCLGPHEVLAFWCFSLLLFEIISKSDLLRAYQIFEIKSVYFL